MPSPSLRARLSSAPSLSFLLLSVLLFLTVASSSAFAHPRPHGGLSDHPDVLKPRDLRASGTRPTSPRPTPNPVSGGFKHLMATYQSLPSLPSLLSKRANATTCYGSDTTAAMVSLDSIRREERVQADFFCLPHLVQTPRSTTTSLATERLPVYCSSALERLFQSPRRSFSPPRTRDCRRREAAPSRLPTERH